MHCYLALRPGFGVTGIPSDREFSHASHRALIPSLVKTLPVTGPVHTCTPDFTPECFSFPTPNSFLLHTIMVSPTRSEEIQQATARHHGLPLLPHPSDDVRDPLRWPRYTKIAALVVTAFVNFTANFAGAGFSVATTVLEKEFDKSQNQINALLTVSRIHHIYLFPLSARSNSSNSSTFCFSGSATTSGSLVRSNLANDQLSSFRFYYSLFSSSGRRMPELTLNYWPPDALPASFQRQER